MSHVTLNPGFSRSNQHDMSLKGNIFLSACLKRNKPAWNVNIEMINVIVKFTVAVPVCSSWRSFVVYKISNKALAMCAFMDRNTSQNTKQYVVYSPKFWKISLNLTVILVTQNDGSSLPRIFLSPFYTRRLKISNEWKNPRLL